MFRHVSINCKKILIGVRRVVWLKDRPSHSKNSLNTIILREFFIRAIGIFQVTILLVHWISWWVHEGWINDFAYLNYNRISAFFLVALNDAHHSFFQSMVSMVSILDSMGCMGLLHWPDSPHISNKRVKHFRPLLGRWGTISLSPPTRPISAYLAWPFFLRKQFEWDTPSQANSAFWHLITCPTYPTGWHLWREESVLRDAVHICKILWNLAFEST